jgi:hypothetical protein
MDWFPTTNTYISDTDVGRLLAAYPVSKYLQKKFRPHIKKNWATRNNGSGKQLSVDELIELLQSDCSKSQMRNIGDTEEQIKAMEQSGAPQDIIESNFDTRSKYYTDGVYGVVGEDVIWENGVVKDFADKGDRYVACAEEIARKGLSKAATGARRRKKRRTRKTKRVFNSSMRNLR